MASYTTIDGDMIDRICWRYYGVSSGPMEMVMAANPHIRQHGEKLPAGLVIDLPPFTLPVAEKQVKLWD